MKKYMKKVHKGNIDDVMIPDMTNYLFYTYF